ncbi:MAG: ClbS/DfsB family four-helix bundle protein [Chloroflexi bacterium CFX2]|nr:ClbS/DfsB family four-helix bundle protein [Chloroflexi bacterium CFX2]
MTEQWMPGNKQELLSAIEREWKFLIRLADSLTDEQITAPDEGGWSPKDNLAHLAEWMNLLMGYHMDKRPYYEVIGISQEVLPEWSVEAVNPILFERNQSRSRADVMDHLRHAYSLLLAKLEKTPFEDLLKPRRPDNPDPLLLWVLGDTTEHFQEHRETIEKGIKNT